MWYLYLDESGDLGFDFVNKKPSKFFVITILAIQGHDKNRQLFNGVKKTIRRKLNPKGKRSRIVQELKGTNTTFEVKNYFFDQIRHIEFNIYSIILNKKRVFDSLAKEKARVYNYIARLIIDRIPLEDAGMQINFVIDKSKSKPEILDFNHYIKSNLQAKIKPSIPLFIDHLNSCDSPGLQAVDMFSYGFFEAKERKRCQWLNVFRSKVAYYTTYLP